MKIKLQEKRYWTDVNTGKNMTKPGKGCGYVGPPYMKEKTDGPVLVGNYPPAVLVQQGFDTRYAEERVIQKGLNFIGQSISAEEPFFLYVGMRAAHKPFNSPLEYRNKSMVGTLGDNIIELDTNVGKIMSLLEDKNALDNTIILFLSDNGADMYCKTVFSMFGHHQNSMDINGENVVLSGGKEYLYEGGHRLPMIWHWPEGINPGENTENVVSYIDIYATLAKIIGVDLKCNQAPDSRNLVPLIKKMSGFDEKPIVHHGLRRNIYHSIRSGDWKFTDGQFPELFNLKTDLAEEKNVYAENDELAGKLRKKLNNILKKVDVREKETDFGRYEIC